MNKIFDNTLSYVTGGFIFINPQWEFEVIDDKTGNVLANCREHLDQAIRTAESLSQSTDIINWEQLASIRRGAASF